MQRVTKVNTTILGFPIGYRSGSEENASQEQIDDESLMITSDFNFVNVDFYVEYKVSDPVKYLYNSQQPKERSSKYRTVPVSEISSATTW